MLALRLQRTGRRGYALYRLIAQDAHRSPTSGKVAAYLGHYNPHTKKVIFDRTKVEFYLEHGAQPSPRVIALLEGEGLKLPAWVRRAPVKQRSIKKPEKLRRNRPAEPEASVDETPEPAETSEKIEGESDTSEAKSETAVDTTTAAETDKQLSDKTEPKKPAEADIEPVTQPSPEPEPAEPAKPNPATEPGDQSSAETV